MPSEAPVRRGLAAADAGAEARAAETREERSERREERSERREERSERREERSESVRERLEERLRRVLDGHPGCSPPKATRCSAQGSPTRAVLAITGRPVVDALFLMAPVASPSSISPPATLLRVSLDARRLHASGKPAPAVES